MYRTSYARYGFSKGYYNTTSSSWSSSSLSTKCFPLDPGPRRGVIFSSSSSLVSTFTTLHSFSSSSSSSTSSPLNLSERRDDLVLHLLKFLIPSSPHVVSTSSTAELEEEEEKKKKKKTTPTTNNKESQNSTTGGKAASPLVGEGFLLFYFFSSPPHPFPRPIFSTYSSGRPLHPSPASSSNSSFLSRLFPFFFTPPQHPHESSSSTTSPPVLLSFARRHLARALRAAYLPGTSDKELMRGAAQSFQFVLAELLFNTLYPALYLQHFHPSSSPDDVVQNTHHQPHDQETPPDLSASFPSLSSNTSASIYQAEHHLANCVEEGLATRLTGALRIAAELGYQIRYDAKPFKCQITKLSFWFGTNRGRPLMNKAVLPMLGHYFIVDKDSLPLPIRVVVSLPPPPPDSAQHLLRGARTANPDTRPRCLTQSIITNFKSKKYRFSDMFDLWTKSSKLGTIVRLSVSIFVESNLKVINPENKVVMEHVAQPTVHTLTLEANTGSSRFSDANSDSDDDQEVKEWTLVDINDEMKGNFPVDPQWLQNLIVFADTSPWSPPSS